MELPELPELPLRALSLAEKRVLELEHCAMIETATLDTPGGVSSAGLVVESRLSNETLTGTQPEASINEFHGTFSMEFACCALQTVHTALDAPACGSTGIGGPSLRYDDGALSANAGVPNPVNTGVANPTLAARIMTTIRQASDRRAIVGNLVTILSM